MKRAFCLAMMMTMLGPTAAAPGLTAPVRGLEPAAGQAETIVRPVVGAVAAPLESHVRWLDGAPVPRFEPGTVYVLDLWATWCVSCIARMPHLSALARAHADDGLKIVGVAVMQEGAAMTPSAFLRVKPGAMTYAVAEELANNAVPPLYQPPPGGFVPFMVIVERQGRIAWISNARDPFEGFEEALRAILAGTWNLEEAAASDRRRAELEAAAAPLERAARERHDAGDAEGLRAVVNELIELDASLVGNWATEVYRLLGKADPVSARAFAAETARDGLSSNAPALLDLARALTRDPDPGAHDLALWAARRADRLKRGTDPDFIWALAKLEDAAGETHAAIATMERALAAARALGWDSSVTMMMERELAAYRRR